MRRILGSIVLAASLTTATPLIAQTIDDPGSGGPSGQPIPRPVLTGQCIKPEQGKELYGPTDVNAQAGNQGLTVGFNRQGTITVFKWPSPSYYDQVKFHANSRAEPYAGARPNEGTFLGVAVTTAAGTSTRWLRDFPEIVQRHGRGAGDGAFSDEVVTTYVDPALGLTVTVSDVVAHPDDVLFRETTVRRHSGSEVRGAALVLFENMNLVASKIPAVPAKDWCGEGTNVDSAAYDAEADAIVHELSTVDESTQRPTSVAVAMGFVEPSEAHQVGGDAYEPLAAPDGELPGPTQDAYDDAADGSLRGNAAYAGQTTGALRTSLDLSDGADTVTALYTAGPDPSTATARLAAARAADVDAVRRAKEGWLDAELAGFPFPSTDDPALLALVERALVTLITNVDRESKAIVAAIATQSPYGEDWPRDGAFFDYALDLGGRHDLVVARQRFYAETQQTLEDPDPFLTALGVPPGNWGMNYYADGVVGGPIPWEIDETGYSVWNFWQHHRATGDLGALEAIWPTLSAAADFLVTCADPTNGLQCRAIEDDNPDLRQTLVGASATWMALDSARQAAAALGEDEAAGRYSARADELAAAIDAHLHDGTMYGPGARAEIVWPACFKDFDDPRFVSHYDALWKGVARSFAEPQAGERAFGLYEAKGLISLAKAWKGQPEKMAAVRRGIDWIAREHATPDTHVMGEVWQVEDGEVISIVSQPHAWEQVLTYLAALEAYPPAGYEDVRAGCDGVLGALRADASPRRVGAPPVPAPGAEAKLPATGSDAPLGLVALLLGVATIATRRLFHHRSTDAEEQP